MENLVNERRSATLAHVGANLLNYLDAETEKWHAGANDKLALREHLGLTAGEYQVFAVQPSDLPAMLAAPVAKRPCEMLFGEFAESVKPSGAANRLPQLGSGQEVLSYSVYMNGPLVTAMPEEAREHVYRDVMLHALTEKLGLNSESFRDNLKVAELVATRAAYMSVVLDASTRKGFEADVYKPAPEVMSDYETLTKGLDHPWFRKQLDMQRALSASLQPALSTAAGVLGMTVAEIMPEEVTCGVVVSQNLDFTVQSNGNGSVVAHENRRLAELPVVGQDVTVVYYRGNGQVFANEKSLDVSAPFVDAKTGDLAVTLLNGSSQGQQVVLFNGLASFAKFVEEQDLDKKLVEQAIEARTATPKKSEVKGAGAEIKTAVKEMVAWVDDRVGKPIESVCNGNVYKGSVLHENELLTLQNLGLTVAIHEKRLLDRVPPVNSMASIKVQDGRGVVTVAQEKVAGKEKSAGR